MAPQAGPLRHAARPPDAICSVEQWAGLRCRGPAPAPSQQLQLIKRGPESTSPLALLQVLVYDALSCTVRRTFTRFKDKAYSGSFRGDGRLLVAGGEEGMVQVGGGGHSEAQSPPGALLCLR